MLIRYGFDIALDLAQPSTILAMMDLHSDVRDRIVEETELKLSPGVVADRFIDGGGNVVRRLTAPAGHVSLRLDGVFRSDGREDEADLAAKLVAPSDLPPETLPFLRPSRYCETELLSDFAWANFGAIGGGWARVQAVCDFVHQHLKFSYPEARPTRTAGEAMAERRRRMPRLHPSGRRAVSVSQHPGALLQRLSRRHRRSARSCADGFQRVVRGLYRRSVVHLRPAAQSAADRSHLDRARARCGGHPDDHDFRFACANPLRRSHRGDQGKPDRRLKSARDSRLRFRPCVARPRQQMKECSLCPTRQQTSIASGP